MRLPPFLYLTQAFLVACHGMLANSPDSAADMNTMAESNLSTLVERSSKQIYIVSLKDGNNKHAIEKTQDFLERLLENRTSNYAPTTVRLRRELQEM